MYNILALNPSVSDLDHGAGLVFSSMDVKSFWESATFTESADVLRGRRVNLNNWSDGLKSFEISWKAEKII